MVRHYPAIIEKASEGYTVFFPDLPGCTSAGDTVQEAALNAEQALQAHVELGLEHGDTIPEPSTLDQIAADPSVIEAARILVRVDPPARAISVSITLPEDLLAAVDQHAARMGYSRSGLLAWAVRERMRRDQTAA